MFRQFVNMILNQTDIIVILTLILTLITVVIGFLSLVFMIISPQAARNIIIKTFNLLVKTPILLSWKNKYSSFVTLLFISSLTYIYQIEFKTSNIACKIRSNTEIRHDKEKDIFERDGFAGLAWEEESTYYSIGQPDIPAYFNSKTYTLYIDFDDPVKKCLDQFKGNVEFINHEIEHFRPCVHTWYLESIMGWTLVSRRQSPIADSCEEEIILSIEQGNNIEHKK